MGRAVRRFGREAEGHREADGVSAPQGRWRRLRGNCACRARGRGDTNQEGWMGLVDWLKNNLRDDRPMKVAEPTGAKQLDLDGYPLDDFAEYPTVQLSGENRIMSLDGIGYDYARIYASQQNVRTVIDFIARQAAGLTLKMRSE